MIPRPDSDPVKSGIITPLVPTHKRNHLRTHLILVVDLLEVRPGDDAVEAVREGPQRPLPVPIPRSLVLAGPAGQHERLCDAPLGGRGQRAQLIVGLQLDQPHEALALQHQAAPDIGKAEWKMGIRRDGASIYDAF